MSEKSCRASWFFFFTNLTQKLISLSCWVNRIHFFFSFFASWSSAGCQKPNASTPFLSVHLYLNSFLYLSCHCEGPSFIHIAMMWCSASKANTEKRRHCKTAVLVGTIDVVTELLIATMHLAAFVCPSVCVGVCDPVVAQAESGLGELVSEISSRAFTPCAEGIWGWGGTGINGETFPWRE